MAKEIIDIYVEQGYSYNFDIDFNLFDGTDLEDEYTCYFYSTNIGEKEYTLEDNQWKLTLSESDTGKLVKSLEEYSVYAKNNITQLQEKLLSGRIILDKKIRS
jgi:hypothetical protein